MKVRVRTHCKGFKLEGDAIRDQIYNSLQTAYDFPDSIDIVLPLNAVLFGIPVRWEIEPGESIELEEIEDDEEDG